MKILFVWTGITSYMGDCWRALQQRADVELKVVVDPLSDAQTSFKAEREFHGLDYQLVSEGEVCSRSRRVDAWRPDIIFLVGWRSKVCRYFAEAKAFADVPKVCCLDMPWRWKLRCLVAPLFLRRYARKFAGAFVPGRFCERYCNWIGFKKVWKGLFAIDTTRFSSPSSSPSPSPYFLYLGRYSKEKRLDLLLEGYRRYRAAGGRKDLRLYGKGEALPADAASVPGVSVNGFVPPSVVPQLMRNAAAFVLASEFDPWPLVLLEAMSAGARIIASDKCTNGPELGATWGRYKTGDAAALARQMLRVDELKVADASVYSPYDCQAWVVRTLNLAKEVCGA